ncbi:MAG: phosphoribosylamine--glycine ligase [Acidimicrobiia bacterium]|nr:phosphoribosylamine--glycine ligase [Acidimicrobiia bacterium]
MRVLLLGGGGREHAIGWKLAASPHLDHLVAAPGNLGLASVAEIVPSVAAEDVAAVVALAGQRDIDLVVVGPEQPLAAGVVDALSREGIAAFGPTADSARLESSKSYAKQVMKRAGVTSPLSIILQGSAAAGAGGMMLELVGPPYVVKADGLAAGKGVLVTEDLDAAVAWVGDCAAGRFGEAGNTVVIEEHLAGREVSVFAICDGITAVPLQPARDYKRLGDGDTGPNTGGMGCYSPVDDLPTDLVDRAMGEVIAPVLGTLAAEGTPYRGFLYAGLMLTDDGLRVLEFNCRLGDPETQVVLPRLEDDLLPLLADAATGKLAAGDLRWSRRAAVDVVLAAAGYPGPVVAGDPISGLDRVDDDVLVFHAGTRDDGDRLVTGGGRVLNLVGIGADITAARAAAYVAAETVDFPGKQYRKDIASG